MIATSSRSTKREEYPLLNFSLLTHKYINNTLHKAVDRIVYPSSGDSMKDALILLGIVGRRTFNEDNSNSVRRQHLLKTRKNVRTNKNFSRKRPCYLTHKYRSPKRELRRDHPMRKRSVNRCLQVSS